MRYFGLSLVCFAVLAVSQLTFAQTTPVVPAGYVVITENPTVDVSGHIYQLVGDAKAPYANVTVSFYNGDDFVASVTTDANGAFEIKGIPAGNYTMVAVDEVEGNYGATDVVLTKNLTIEKNMAVLKENELDMILDGKNGLLTHTKYANMISQPTAPVSTAATPAAASTASMGSASAGGMGAFGGGMGGIGGALAIAGLATGIVALADNDDNYKPVPVTTGAPANK